MTVYERLSVFGLLALLLAATAATAQATNNVSSVCETCAFADLDIANFTSEVDARFNQTQVNFLSPEGNVSIRTFCFTGPSAAAAMADFRTYSWLLQYVYFGAENCQGYTGTTTPAVSTSTTTTAATTTTVIPTPPPTTTTMTTMPETTQTPTPNVSTMAPTTTTAPRTPAPTEFPVLEFTVKFRSEGDATTFASKLAAAYNISVDDIVILSSDGATLVFTFRGTSASALSRTFNSTTIGALGAAFNIDSVSSRPAPPPPTPADGGDNLRLALVIGIPVGGVLLIAAAVLIIRSKSAPKDEARVNFHDYVQMTNKNGGGGGGGGGVTQPLL